MRLTVAAALVGRCLVQKCQYLFNPLDERDRLPFVLFQWRAFLRAGEERGETLDDGEALAVAESLFLWRKYAFTQLLDAGKCTGVSIDSIMETCHL
jgi:hypothetical protein